ncbi:hypothetical protein [Nonomuraea sp. NEAU-A123]|uniref:CBU_0592 family membrane protein n=1 Tax=Nonomuraea sp. NEAU-A123 TaxID=2839649 RepID=UPI001BE41B6F|nr:hypothetical protein [Nonomuraea sp. NEAU-A123]MBT2229092.1 hypothetical protein [Nonomuraea sp. NEAU-A123]
MSFLVAVVGWLGAALLLFGYAMITASRMSSDGAPYQLVNLAGSIGLMVNSACNAAWPSAGLNLVWALIGTTALYKLVKIGIAK